MDFLKFWLHLKADPRNEYLSRDRLGRIKFMMYRFKIAQCDITVGKTGIVINGNKYLHNRLHQPCKRCAMKNEPTESGVILPLTMG